MPRSDKSSGFRRVMTVTVAMWAMGVAGSARAAFVAAISPSGSNVVVTGSGSINTSGLLDITTEQTDAQVFPQAGILNNGPSTITNAVAYISEQSVSPNSFGSSVYNYANSGSGDLVGIDVSNSNLLEIFVPVGYSSGASLSDTSTYDNTTLSDMGLAVGTYEWTFPGDSFTIDVVPEPSSLMLFGVVGLVSLKRRRRVGG